MGIKQYNIDEENSKLVQDLKSMPKIKAPENFELNLMTRIQNRNFGQIAEPEPKFNFIKFFAPSAVVVSAVIVFFIFFTPGQRNENPLLSEPPAILSDSQGDISSAGKSIAENIQEKPATINSKKTGQAGAIQNSVKQNDAGIPSAVKYPINRNRSVTLDDYISGDSKSGNNLQRGNVVNSGENSHEFEGFFVRQQPDKATIEKYRAMVDSVKKAQLKADSIKNARK